MNIEVMHPADQIIMFMERIYGYGMTTTSGGNLSIMDDDGSIWITPSGVDKGSLTRDDIMCVKADGTVTGRHKPSVELPFHSTLYKRRPDIRAVLHAHPPTLVSFSLVDRIPEINLIPNANLICGKVCMAGYDLPGSVSLGEKIAREFDKGVNTVLMANHGVVCGAGDLFSAFMAFETLEFCARLEVNALRIGKPEILSDEAVEISKSKNHADMEEFTAGGYSSAEKEIRRNLCTMIKRSYRQRLFTSTQGTFSQRTDGDNFVITPYGMDRAYLSEADLVRIENGRKEAGKMPSRSVLFHQEIYKKHKDVNSIIIAHPPHIMAFAVTDNEFDSRTIPESYIALRNVKKVPFGSSYINAEKTAEEITSMSPVLLVENDCLIVTGSSLINAFDRLEVAEYSAKSVIDSVELGDITMIDNSRVDEINRAFNIK